MTSGTTNTAVPVKDLAAAKSLYSALLGVEPYTDSPYYVGYRVAGHELGLDPHGHDKGMTGPVGYWEVDDIHGTVDALVAAGGTVQAPASDVGGGLLVATVVDADGNPIGLRQSA